MNIRPMLTTKVSHLMMLRPSGLSKPCALPVNLTDRQGQAFRLEVWDNPDIEAYRLLYRAVGESYLWYERLVMDDDKLARLIDPTNTTIARLMHGDQSVGYAEWLSEYHPGMAYIAYYGLTPGLEGTGLAKPMMQMVQNLIWHHPSQPAMISINTCTMDHPRALGFYLHLGFAVERTTEISFPNPCGVYDSRSNGD